MRPLIYLIRHGEIDTATPRRFLGQTDLALNENGVRQALALGEHLHTIPFTGVFSSPLQRAVHTAVLVSGRPMHEISLTAAFKEIDLGAWEGLSVAEVQDRFPGAYEKRGQDLEHFRPPGGESFGDLAARTVPALLELAERGDGPLLIVAHAGVNRVILSRLLHRPLQRLLEIPQDTCAVNVLRPGLHGWEVAALNLRNLFLPIHPISTTQQGDTR